MPSYNKRASRSDQTEQVVGQVAWTYSERNRMGSFIGLDRYELFDSELGVRESGGEKVAFFELGESLRVKLGLELFQNVGECCKWEGVIEVSSAVEYDRKQKANANYEKIIRIKSGDGYALRTRRFFALSCLFHGAAATKSGAARARIEVAKRIVFIGG